MGKGGVEDKKRGSATFGVKVKLDTTALKALDAKAKREKEQQKKEERAKMVERVRLLDSAIFMI